MGPLTSGGAGPENGGAASEPLGPFEFATATRIVFGPGRAAELPALLDGLGTRILLCTGAHPDRYQDLVARLPLPYEQFPVAAEPTVAAVRAATATAREHGADVVVAIGGGSVIDLGKAVAALLTNGGDPMQYLEVIGQGQPVTRPSAPLIAVPTTAGTGAEATANAVLASPEHRLKVSLRSPLMLPRVAVVDPLLTVDCPPAVTAASGLDALTQCLEPFVSNRANPVTDALAREGLRRAGAALRRAYADGADVAARASMALCSLLSGIALANAGLGAVHGLAGVIGGRVDVAHGFACAALLAPVVAANVAALRERDPGAPALARYREAAGLLTGRADASIDDGLEWIRETTARLGVRPLGSYGLTADDFDEVAQRARRASSMRGNPVVLDEAALRAILAEATFAQ